MKIKKKLQVNELLKHSADLFKENVKKNVIPEIKKTILGGNDPVNSGKYAKYSQSYIDQIKGNATFFRKNGKVIAITAISNKELDSYRASKDAKNQNKKNKEFIRKANADFAGKKVSPVNLKLKGDLLNSMTEKNTEKGVRVTFTDPKAEWINNGTKTMPARRLLPDKPGEEFNYNILRRIVKALKDAVKKNL